MSNLVVLKIFALHIPHSFPWNKVKLLIRLCICDHVRLLCCDLMGRHEADSSQVFVLLFLIVF